MNEEIKNTIDETLHNALKDFVEAVGSGKDFILEQAPDVIHQLLAYERAASAVGFLVTFALFFVCLRNFKRSSRDRYSDESEFLFVTGLIGGIISGSLSIKFGLVALKVWIVPKVFLLEYAADLVK